MPRAPGVSSTARALALAATALAAALLVRGALHAALPGPFDPLARAKLVALDARLGSIDTLFVGSSLTYRQVDPALFDRETAARGTPTRSFNLGMSALGPLELDWLLDHVAAEKPRSLRWVVVECGDLAFEHDVDNQGTERVAYWHDAKRTALALRSALHGGAPAAKRWRRAAHHLRAFFHDAAELGRARFALDALLRTGRADPGDQRLLGPAGDGFWPFDDEAAESDEARAKELAAAHERLLARRAKFASSVHALAAGRGDAVPFDPETLEAYARARRTVERMGARAVFVVPPIRARHGTAEVAERDGVVPVVLRFNDPRRYPALYAIDRWFDVVHLDAGGAALYTRALAERFAAVAGGDAAEASR